MIVDVSGYLGFTYNGKHSSEFNIVRTSDGSRFNQNLLPTIQDKTIQISGVPGRIFQHANYDTRVFSIQIAYDEMSEYNMQEMRRWLGDKKIHPLVFDELPYKTWYAKVTGTASTKWLPFEEGATNRFYKGEGTIQFTCYDPFAHCNCRWTTNQYEGAEATKDEWWAASGLGNIGAKNQTISLYINENLLQAEDSSFTISTEGYLSTTGLTLKLDQSGILSSNSFGSTILLYNCGDVETDFTLKLFAVDGVIPKGAIYLYIENDSTQELIGAYQWEEMPLKTEDSYLVFNSKMNLIEGYNTNNKKTGNIYDEYQCGGGYFKLPVGDSSLAVEGYSNDAVIADNVLSSIDFDFLYL